MKLFVFWSEIPKTQNQTTLSNDNESQITGFHKIQDTRAENHRTDFCNKINTIEIKWYSDDRKTLSEDPWKNPTWVRWKQ